MGAPAKTARIAFGALIIKERLGVTDEETVEQITENPYLQYFLCLSEYRDTPLFDPSMMVYFRFRFEQADFTRINEAIIESALSQANPDSNSDDPGGGATHQGKLVLDATCTPADITYPTDLKLLNEGRDKLEKVIDKLHAPFVGRYKKPRTYRQKARKQYLKTAKQKQVGAKKRLVAIGKQLRFIRRDLSHIDTLLERGSSLSLLTEYELRCLWVIHTLYAQQLEMYEQGTRRVDDRIVSISQPHVRPIVRGKPAAKTEFGAKLSVSHTHGGYVLLDKLSWDAYNESGELVSQVQTYKNRFGHYPVSVHADEIYRNQANRRYCKQKGIRLSGKPTAQNQAELKAAREQIPSGRTGSHPHRRQVWQQQTKRHPGPDHGQTAPHQCKRHQHRPDRIQPRQMPAGAALLAPQTVGPVSHIFEPGRLDTHEPSNVYHRSLTFGLKTRPQLRNHLKILFKETLSSILF